MGKFDISSFVLALITFPSGVVVYKYMLPYKILPGVETKLAQIRQCLDEAEARDATFPTRGYRDRLAKYEMHRAICGFGAKRYSFYGQFSSMRLRSREGHNVLQQLRFVVLDCMTYKIYKLSGEARRLREDIEVRKHSLTGPPNRKVLLR
jgi:hypothetical protein